MFFATHREQFGQVKSHRALALVQAVQAFFLDLTRVFAFLQYEA
jgi:hypothetical protein